MTFKLRRRRVWVVHVSPLVWLYAVGSAVVGFPFAWFYGTWLLPATVIVFTLPAIHIVTFAVMPQGTIRFRKFIGFLPVGSLVMEQLSLRADGDAWESDEDDSITVGPGSKPEFPCDHPRDVIAWIRASLYPSTPARVVT